MLSLFDLVGLVLNPVIAIIYGYSAFSAFAIRHTLSERLYRRQALGIGLVGAGFAWQFVGFTFGFGFAPFIAFGFLPFMMVFYWIDASLLAARRSDPLFRDTLEWRGIRIILWPLSIISIAALSIILLVTGQYNTYTPSPPPSGSFIEFLLFFIPIFTPFVSGAIYLPLIAMRSKDRTLRRHLMWFGLFAVCLLGAAISSAPFGPNIATFIAFIAGGYCLYRSTRSLVPVYSFAAEKTNAKR